MLIPKSPRKLLGYLIIGIMGFILSRYIAAKIKADFQGSKAESAHGDRTNPTGKGR